MLLTPILIFAMCCYSTHPSTDSADSTELVAEVKRELKIFQEKYNDLKEEMYWFQKVAGFDFIPQQTKVIFDFLPSYFSCVF